MSQVSTEAYGLTFLVPENDRVVGKALRHFGEFALAEVELIGAYLARCQPGTFVDVGANLGSICLPLARGRRNWRIVAIEAHREIAELLRKNAAANGLDQVDVVHAAAGSKTCLVDFPTPPLNSDINLGRTGMSMSAPTEPVRMVALDGLGLAEVRLIKIDVEGFEAEVLEGARQTIDRDRPILVLEANAEHAEGNQPAFRVLMELGYDLFWFFVPFVSLNGARKTTHLQPARTGDMNVLALPPGAPRIWEMPAIHTPDDSPPATYRAFPYLRRYGF